MTHEITAPVLSKASVGDKRREARRRNHAKYNAKRYAMFSHLDIHKPAVAKLNELKASHGLSSVSEVIWRLIQVAESDAGQSFARACTTPLAELTGSDAQPPAQDPAHHNTLTLTGMRVRRISSTSSSVSPFVGSPSLGQQSMMAVLSPAPRTLSPAMVPIAAVPPSPPASDISRLSDDDEAKHSPALPIAKVDHNDDEDDDDDDEDATDDEGEGFAAASQLASLEFQIAHRLQQKQNDAARPQSPPQQLQQLQLQQQQLQQLQLQAVQPNPALSPVLQATAIPAQQSQSQQQQQPQQQMRPVQIQLQPQQLQQHQLQQLQQQQQHMQPQFLAQQHQLVQMQPQQMQQLMQPQIVFMSQPMPHMQLAQMQPSPVFPTMMMQPIQLVQQRQLA
ncbi:hypothetical protein CAOG_02132 [Capsaspora owczarzaki ATCC 30864]|uniref:Uncharacterized protein n=1 Tax=Capsaspora owczarzaki (strain ATCC 30864) TaxID=595528 RepID=A0A0D2X1J1_CAPO3|nr:hypothetical protein CAOG_02132 [Capsaspora owczarzaki ATCC 30864]KJE90899.1 hypothetical protein CAOG_002132 [Capsaspora owczarzaki ATCC 30864]|eukprot:XP_004348882.1 hypothetical protein CAOG_02132 [Capsaspora owczarzaki ATCC 30864]